MEYLVDLCDLFDDLDGLDDEEPILLLLLLFLSFLLSNMLAHVVQKSLSGFFFGVYI